MAEIRIWNEERKTRTAKEYYVLLVDGDQTIACVLKYDASNKQIIAEPYSPPDIDYTIHDGCDHSDCDYYCALDDPESFESQDVQEASNYSYARQNLEALEKQVRQQRIAERLNANKESKEQPMDPAEVENAIAALLAQLPAHYPEAVFSKDKYGYMLTIEHTVIFKAVSGEAAIEETKDYVEARKTSPTLPIGVIHGLYD